MLSPANLVEDYNPLRVLMMCDRKGLVSVQDPPPSAHKFSLLRLGLWDEDLHQFPGVLLSQRLLPAPAALLQQRMCMWRRCT